MPPKMSTFLSLELVTVLRWHNMVTRKRSFADEIKVTDFKDRAVD